MKNKNKTKKNQKAILPKLSYGWKIEGSTINYKDTYEIGNFKGGKLFGQIDPGFADDPRWENALSKGFAKGAVGKNGVKFLDSKLLELKINDNGRIYTTQVFKNTKGDYLAQFKNYDNHKGITRMLGSIKELSIDSVNDLSIDDICLDSIHLIGDMPAHEIDVY